MSKKGLYVCRALIATAVGLLSVPTSHAADARQECVASADDHEGHDDDCEDGDGCEDEESLVR